MESIGAQVRRYIDEEKCKLIVQCRYILNRSGWCVLKRKGGKVTSGSGTDNAAISPELTVG